MNTRKYGLITAIHSVITQLWRWRLLVIISFYVLVYPINISIPLGNHSGSSSNSLRIITKKVASDAATNAATNAAFIMS